MGRISSYPIATVPFNGSETTIGDQSGETVQFQLSQLSLGGILNLSSVGQTLAGWQAAAAEVNAGNASVIVVPAGLTTILRAGLSNPLNQGLITFTQPVSIVCEEGSVIQFDYIGLPLFCFNSLTGGGVVGRPHLQFTGASPTTDVYTRSQYSSASGFPFSSFEGGDDAELWSMILSNSSNMEFRNIFLESTTPGTTGFTTPFVFNLKSVSSSVFATNNRIQDCVLRDLMFGALTVLQSGLYVVNLDVDRRDGLSGGGIGPGHAFYINNGGAAPTMYCNACVVDGLRDGPNAINFPATSAQNLATMAVKNSQFCEFINIRSYHPNGLMNTLQEVYDSDFTDWTWRTTDTNAPPAAAFNITGTNERNRFAKFRIYAPSKNFFFANTSAGPFTNNFVEDFYVFSDMDLGSGAAQGVFDLNGVSNDFRNITLNPSVTVVGTTQNCITWRQSNSETNTFECNYVGPNVNQTMITANDEAGSGNWFRVGLSAISNNSYFPSPGNLGTGSIQETGRRGGNITIAQSHGSAGTYTATFQLPGTGIYDLALDVQGNSGSTRAGGRYNIVCSNEAGPVSTVNAMTGTTYLGSGFSSVTPSVSSTGLLTITYVVTVGANFDIDIGWAQLAGIPTF